MDSSANSMSTGHVLVADVVVVGAGPAGIVTALELADAGISVVLIESGGWGTSPGLRDLSRAEIVDPMRHAAMEIAVRRGVGGTSVIWGGRCVPYDEVDFDRRDYIPNSDWPIGFAEVNATYARACEYFKCGAPVFDAMEIPRLARRLMAPGLINGDVRASDVERWSLPTNFAREYGPRLRSHRRLRLITHLTCVEIVSEQSKNKVAYLRCVNDVNNEIHARAEHYMLTGGGLEVTRLLLASNRVHPGGIGNHSGHLGRWYMAHVDGRIAQIQYSGAPRLPIVSHERDDDHVYVRRRLSFARETLHRHELPNIVAWTVNPDLFDASHGSGALSFAYLALRSPAGPRFAPDAIRRALTAGRASPVRQHLRNVVAHPLATTRFACEFGYRRFVPRRRAPGFFVRTADNRYPLHYHGEQIPNPDSRVTLATERDARGMRRLKIDLRFTTQDAAAIVRAHELWDHYLRKVGAGYLIMGDGDLASQVAEQTEGGFHQIGTTRMSSRASGGVVTRDLNVHGMENVFVVSSSVFCSAGQANSTFLVVALALRCADHLRARMGVPRNS